MDADTETRITKTRQAEATGVSRGFCNTKSAPGTCGRSGNRVTMGTSYEKAEE
nr:MAG TPA: hypothetical protein [Inoviridae sp.]